MTPDILNIVRRATGADTITDSQMIQSLWSGYGQITRLRLTGGAHSSIILKHIKLLHVENHPRGWNTNLSHHRKLQSYRVEAHWYRNYARHCTSDCVVPLCLTVDEGENDTVLILSDLDAAGFHLRKSDARLEDILGCLNWLANFHAVFLNSTAEGLWECGTYWHLATRPDELAAMDDTYLREAAPIIDRALTQSRYQTLVHGDAKLANFCFKKNDCTLGIPTEVAAVDFQYVGRGCGMKDVAYFIGSCLNNEECEAMETRLLDYYFSVLAERLSAKRPMVNTIELEKEWRELYPVAWADFNRFLNGWNPGHWKINAYSEKLTQGVLDNLSRWTK